MVMYEELEELDKANRACIEMMKKIIDDKVNDEEIIELARRTLEHTKEMQRDLGFGD